MPLTNTTIMLVYAANMYPGYTKKPEPDMVEQYKEEKYYSNRDKAVKGAVSSIIWTLALVVYFVVSFATDVLKFSKRGDHASGVVNGDESGMDVSIGTASGDIRILKY